MHPECFQLLYLFPFRSRDFSPKRKINIFAVYLCHMNGYCNAVLNTLCSLKRTVLVKTESVRKNYLNMHICTLYIYKILSTTQSKNTYHYIELAHVHVMHLSVFGLNYYYCISGPLSKYETFFERFPIPFMLELHSQCSISLLVFYV